MQFGASQVTRDRETKALISLGDDLKAAATDALKKCATFLGVGLHLYAERPLRPESGAAGLGRTPAGGGARRRGPEPDRNGAGGAAPAVSPTSAPTPGRPGSGIDSPPAPAVPASREAATPTAPPRRRHAAPAPGHLADRPRQGARPRGGGGDEPPGVQPEARRAHDRRGVGPDPRALDDAARGGLTAARASDPAAGEG